MRAKRYIREDHMEICVLIVFFLSVIIRTVIGGFPKHISVMNDEMIYYATAENLANQHMFSIFHGKFVYDGSRVLYSILISPAFLTANRRLQFVLITMINSMILSSGIIPTYLLAKDILKSKKASTYRIFIYPNAGYVIQHDFYGRYSYPSAGIMVDFSNLSHHR